MIHWTTGVPIIVLIVWAVIVIAGARDEASDYEELAKMFGVFWTVPVVLFLAIWGGIFWW